MRYLLLYNPVSGRVNFRTQLPRIKKIFEKSNHDLSIYESKAAKDLEKVAFEKAKDYDVFLIAGGDGTINEVLNGVMKSDVKPIMGILPSGTANDIAAILGINKNIKRSLKLYFNANPVQLDVNQLNEQYFIYTAASGMLTRVSYDVSRRHIKKYGYIAYVIAGMKDLAHDYKYPITIKYNGKVEMCECVMVLGLSTNRVGGMRLYNFSNSKLNDGLFELRLFKRVKSFWRFRLLSSLIRGGKKLREDLHLVSDHFEITTHPDVEWNADGEYSTKGSVEIKVHKEAVRFYACKRTKKKYF